MESALDAIIKAYVKNEMACGEDETGTQRPDENANYVQELHDCLERKGVMRELQAFLRQKLVLILQDKWPQLNAQSGGGGSDREPLHPYVLQLVQDFLSSRKLLFTLSVFAGELGLQNVSRDNFTKMRCKSAERLLEELNIPQDSQTSRLILKKYVETERCSLLECIIQFSTWSAESSDSPQTVPTSAEDRLTVHNLSSRSHEKSGTLDSRLKRIDEFFDSKKRKEGETETLKKGGVEERLHLIQKAMEKDKKVQIQMAIKKFREEEESKIRDEIKHKLEFEMLSKEKELLTNFKERAQCMKESLEQEKAAWAADKERQERQLAESERQLQRMMESLSQRSKHDVVTGRSTSEDFKRPKFTHTDDPVLREAQLQATIRRLQEENQRQRPYETVDNRQNQLSAPQCQSSYQEVPSQGRDIFRDIERDKIAFLQYNLEQQSEEIKQLKEQLLLAPSQSAGPNSNKKDTPEDIFKFLSESKKRCEQIEEEAKSVERKLKEVRQRSRSCSPITSFFSPRKPTPTILSTYSSILPQVLAEQMHAINIPLRSQINIPFLTNPTPRARQSLSADPLKATRDRQQLRSDSQFHPDFHNSKDAGNNTMERIQKQSNQTHHNNSPPTPDQISVKLAIKKLKNEAKLATAVHQGALSFEKITSSSEMEDEVSLKVDSSREIGRRISFSGDTKKEDQTNRGSNTGGEGEEPVKLVQDEISEKSASFSLSGPGSQKSRASAEDSDFWKL